MIKSIGIRREDRSIWERRVPIIPEHLPQLIESGLEFKIQPSTIRCHPDESFSKAGACVTENVGDCDLLIGVKEMPIEFIQQNKVHLFFSHTIKGQDYNMPLLQNILDKKATLIDYERIVNDSNQRLIAFGRFAGLAGIIDTLAIFGRKMASENKKNPFSKLKFSHQYADLAESKKAIKEIATELQDENIKKEMGSLRIGVPGYGNVSQGVQEILELLPLKKINPDELIANQEQLAYVVFKEEDIVSHKDNKDFEIQDYYQNPQHYESCFDKYLPFLEIIANSIYWDERYPRLVTISKLKSMFNQQNLTLKVVGDISCDVNGSIECTVKATDPEQPVYVFDPVKESIIDGWEGPGVAILAVDILPAEFSLDASKFFSDQLVPLLPAMVKADYTQKFESSGLPSHLQKAVIVWQGELTPSYRHLQQYL